MTNKNIDIIFCYIVDFRILKEENEIHFLGFNAKDICSLNEYEKKRYKSQNIDFRVSYDDIKMLSGGQEGLSEGDAFYIKRDELKNLILNESIVYLTVEKCLKRI